MGWRSPTGLLAVCVALAATTPSAARRRRYRPAAAPSPAAPRNSAGGTPAVGEFDPFSCTGETTCNPGRQALFAVMHNVFTKEECRRIVQVMAPRRHALVSATRGGIQGFKTQTQSDAEVRRGELKWFDAQAKDAAWLYERLLDAANKLNAENWRFGALYAEESLQLAKYVPGDHYTWHTDGNGMPESKKVIAKDIDLMGRRKPTWNDGSSKHGVDRVLSLSVQLAEPGAYTEGNLQVRAGHVPHGTPPRTARSRAQSHAAAAAPPADRGAKRHICAGRARPVSVVHAAQGVPGQDRSVVAGRARAQHMPQAPSMLDMTCMRTTRHTRHNNAEPRPTPPGLRHSLVLWTLTEGYEEDENSARYLRLTDQSYHSLQHALHGQHVGQCTPPAVWRRHPATGTASMVWPPWPLAAVPDITLKPSGPAFAFTRPLSRQAGSRWSRRSGTPTHSTADSLRPTSVTPSQCRSDGYRSPPCPASSASVAAAACCPV